MFGPKWWIHWGHYPKRVLSEPLRFVGSRTASSAGNYEGPLYTKRVASKPLERLDCLGCGTASLRQAVSIVKETSTTSSSQSLTIQSGCIIAKLGNQLVSNNITSSII